MLEIARERHPDATTITCNSGIKLLPTPDYFVAVDQVATLAYREAAASAQEAGTKLVTLARKESALKERGVTHFDLFVAEAETPEPTRETWGPFRYSGPFCIQFALRHGATRIVLAGMCGWAKAFDYFDADDHPCTKIPASDDWERTMTRQWVEPETNALCRLFPEVEFICYGKPNYTVDADNWRVVEPYTPRALAQRSSA